MNVTTSTAPDHPDHDTPAMGNASGDDGRQVVAGRDNRAEGWSRRCGATAARLLLWQDAAAWRYVGAAIGQEGAGGPDFGGYDNAALRRRCGGSAGAKIRRRRAYPTADRPRRG